MPPKKSNTITIAAEQLSTKRNIKQTEKILQTTLQLRQADTNFKRETIKKKFPSTIVKSKLPKKISKIDETQNTNPTRSKRIVKPTAKALSHMEEKKKKMQAEIKVKKSDEEEKESKQIKPISESVIDTKLVEQTVKKVKKNEDIVMVEGAKKEKKVVTTKKKIVEEKPNDERIKRIKKPTVKILNSNLKLRQIKSIVPEQKKKTNIVNTSLAAVKQKPVQKPILITSSRTLPKRAKKQNVLNSSASDTTVIESIGKCSVLKQKHIPIYKHIQNIPLDVKHTSKDVYSLTEFTENQSAENNDDPINDIIKKLRQENKIIIKHPKRKRLIKKPFRMEKDKKTVEIQIKKSNKEIARTRENEAIINRLINNLVVNDNDAVNLSVDAQHTIDKPLTQSTPKPLLDKHSKNNLTDGNEINKPLPRPSNIMKNLVSTSNKQVISKNANSQTNKSNNLNKSIPALIKPMLTPKQTNPKPILTDQIYNHQTTEPFSCLSGFKNKVISTFNESMSQLNKPMTQSTPKPMREKNIFNDQNTAINKPSSNSSRSKNISVVSNFNKPFTHSTPITNINKPVTNTNRTNRNLINKSFTNSSTLLMDNNLTEPLINTISDDENINQFSNIENVQPSGYEKIVDGLKYLPQNMNLNKKQALRNRKPLLTLSSAISSKSSIQPTYHDKNIMIKPILPEISNNEITIMSSTVVNINDNDHIESINNNDGVPVNNSNENNNIKESSHVIESVKNDIDNLFGFEEFIDPNYDETPTTTIVHNKLQQILTNVSKTYYETINKKKTNIKNDNNNNNTNYNNNNESKSKRYPVNSLFTDLSEQKNKQKDIRDVFKSVPKTSNNTNVVIETDDTIVDADKNILTSALECTSIPTHSTTSTLNTTPIIFADLQLPISPKFYKGKRKRCDNYETDVEHQEKHPRLKKPNKHEILKNIEDKQREKELDSFAKEFNSICDEIDQYNLVIE